MASEKKLLEELEKDTVDTSRWTVDDEAEAREAFEIAAYRTRGGVAVPQVDGTLRAWHVTDDPGTVLELIRTKGEFYPREGDLCSGLYVSANPHYWRGRSTKRWDFMKEIPPEARGVLYTAIYDQLVDQAKSGYITGSELENAQRIVAQAMTTDYWQVVSIVADQPYNINIQRLAKDLGIAEPAEAAAVQIDFIGRYLEFNTRRAIDAYMELVKKRYGTLKVTRDDLCDMLDGYGWDGIFTQSGFGSNPELVIWNPERILTFGDWQRPMAGMSGKDPRPFVLQDPEHPRFEAWISHNRRVADVDDTEKKRRLILLNLNDVEDLKRTLEGVLQGLYTFQDPRGKLESEVPKYYTYSVYLDLRRMDEFELRELIALLERLSETLVP